MEKRERMRGIALTIIGGIFWGLSGVCGQYLFQEKELTARWLVCIRLLSAGLIMLASVYVKQKNEMWKVWKNKHDTIQLLLFGVLGMGACQLTYFSAVETSNAGTATVLQYTAPIMIMGYTAFQKKKMPVKLEITALVLAVGGTFLLATHGDIHNLTISREALLWGIGAAVSMALYNLLPVKLMPKYGTFCIVGFSMLIGGIALCPFVQPWHVVGIWDIKTVLAFSAVILVGTLLSFACYMEGVRIIGAPRASLFASVEPVTATIAVVVFMGAVFGIIDFIGFVCILGAVLLLTLIKEQK